jgi:hypothetical protein
MGAATRGWAGILLVGWAAATVACGADDATEGGRPNSLELATVPLSGDQEVPPASTGASGEATATLTGNLLRVTGSFEGLESDLLNVAGSYAHVHDAPRGQAGPVVFNLQVTPGADMRSGTFEGEMLLDQNQLQALEAGRFYVNVHTASHPTGEIRGQFDDGTPEVVEEGPAGPSVRIDPTAAPKSPGDRLPAPPTKVPTLPPLPPAE